MSRIAVIALAGLFAILPSLAHADEQETIRYRRIEVPQDRIAEFVPGLLPIPSREFESLVSPEMETENRSFDSASYSATLDGNQLKQGKASLVVSDRKNVASGELMTVGGALAMSDARWVREKSSTQAILGFHDGEPTVIANPYSREFEFNWSQHGETRDRVHYFDILFPEAFVQELLLEVPANLSVVAPGALIERQVTESTAEGPLETVAWSIRWSGRSRIQLAFSPKTESKATAQIDSRYRIDSSGLNLLTQIKIDDVRNTSVLELKVDPTLTVTSVNVGDSAMLFTSSEDAANTILVELPTAKGTQLESSISFQVSAIGQLPFDTLHSLPRVRPQCEWESETVRCRVDESLSVVDLKLLRCECRFLKHMESSGGEWFAFDMKSKSADIQLQLERSRAEFATESFTVIQFQDNTVLAECEVKFQPLEGKLFELELNINANQGWGVNAATIEAFAESAAMPTSLLTNMPQIENGKLTLRLREAATTDRSINVRFQLQNNSLAAKPTTAIPQLHPVSVSNASDNKSWIYIEDTPGIVLGTSGSEHGRWQTVDADDTSLPDWIGQRVANEFASSPQDLFLRYNTAAALVQIARRSEKALPRVQSNTQIEFNEERLRYALEIDVDPLGEELNTLAVSFSHPTPIANWSFVGRSETPVVNRTEPKSSGVDPHQILFSAISEPFRLRLEFENSFSLQAWKEMPLATVVNAAGGEGLISLFTEGLVDVDIQQGKGLGALPLSSKKIEDRSLSLRSAFRYDDTAASPPSLKVRTLKQTTSALAWAWRTDLRSYYAEEGLPRHRADVFVQVEADAELTFELPLGFLFEKVEVDGIAVEPSRPIDGTQQKQFRIPLPASKRQTCVTIKYVEADRTLRSIDRLSPPLPNINLSSMQETWQIWLPHDYRVFDPENANSQSWLRRLVGFFATPRGLELEASVVRSVQRMWSADVDDPLGLIRQIEVLLAPVPPYVTEDDDGSLHWGSKLQTVAGALGRSRNCKLYVDREEMRRIGVFANTPLPKTSYSNPRRMGISRLSQSGLVVITEGKRALITSASEARRRTRPTDWVDEVGADGIIDRFGTSRLLSVERWINEDFEQLWRPSRDELEIGLQRAGWSPNRNDIDLAGRPVQVYHRDTIMALACSIFCFGFALGWRLYQRHRRRSFTICAVAMAAALLLPQPGATLAVAFGWAMFASGLLRYAMRSRRQSRRQEPVIRRLSPTKAGSWIIVCIALCFGAASELAAQDLGTVNLEDVNEEFVYFPTDNAQEPIDTVYLSPEFYRVLKRQKNANGSKTKFLLTKTKYAGNWPTVGSVVRLSATYHVTTLSKNVQFTIPDFGDNVNVSASSIRANRKPIAAQSNDDKTTIRLASAGDYRISFDLTAKVAQENENSRLKMKIPVAADSTIELRTPRSISAVESSTALGQQDFDKQQHAFSATLGPTSDLDVTVTSPRDNRNVVSDLPNVEQITWVKVGRQTVDVWVRFDFEGESFDLKVEVDPALVPDEETIRNFQWNEESSTLNTEAAPTAWMRFEFPREGTKRIRIPSIEAQNANVTQKRLAVSSSLQANVRIDRDEAESLPPSSFLSVSDEIDAEPDLYVQVAKDLPTIDLIAVPSLEDWSCDVSYFFDQIETRVEVESQLVPQYETPRVVPYRRLRVPNSLQIDQLVASNSLGVPLRIRWRRHGDEVTIFFIDEVEASSTTPLGINIFGTVPTRDLIALSVVEFVPDLADSSSVRNLVRIYRAANVDIILEGSTAPFVPDAIDPDVPDRPGYILHGVWTSETVGFQSSPDALTIRRNTLERNTEGSLTTRLVYDEVWSAEITAEIVSNDEVDAIYFDLPASLCSQPPVAYEAEEELRVDEVTGGSTIGRRMIAVWLPHQERSNRTVQLVASLQQDQTSLPDVRLVNVQLKETDGQPQRFAELPVESRADDSDGVEATLFNWKLSGLVPIPSDEANYERFRVLETDGTALLDETPAGLQAEVLLLSTNVTWRENKSYVAMSELYVNPASQSKLLLELPPNAGLIQVLCDERHTAFSEQQVTDGSSKKRTLHEFRLNSSPWPQRVQIIYSGNARTNGSQSLTVQAPLVFARGAMNQLQPLSVSEEIWSIAGPGAFGFPSANRASDDPIDQAVSDAIRLDAFTELWSRAQASIRERSRDEKTSCLQTWTNHLRGTLDRYEDENESQQEIELLMVNYPDAFPDTFSIDDSERLPLDELWKESQWTDGQAVEFQSATPIGGEFPTIELTYRRGPLGSWPRYLLAIGCLAIGVFFPRWNQSSRMLDRAFDQPHATTALFGLFWWLFLSPYWIGAFLIILALAVWTWSRFRTYHLAIRR